MNRRDFLKSLVLLPFIPLLSKFDFKEKPVDFEYNKENKEKIYQYSYGKNDVFDTFDFKKFESWLDNYKTQQERFQMYYMGIPVVVSDYLKENEAIVLNNSVDGCIGYAKLKSPINMKDGDTLEVTYNFKCLEG